MSTDPMLSEAAEWDRIDCLRIVANGKIDALYREARRLALRGLLGRIPMTAAADILHEAALSNGLYQVFGVEFIQDLLSDAYADAAVTAGAFVVERQEAA
jgi:hypothetical protein